MSAESERPRAFGWGEIFDKVRQVRLVQELEENRVESLRRSYHRVERFDPEKAYDFGEFEADFGKGPRKYCWSALVSKSGASDSDLPVAFVYAEEVLTDQDKKRLLPFCDCVIHSQRSTLISILGRVIGRRPCACCVGCVESEFSVPQDRIDRARDRFERANSIGSPNEQAADELVSSEARCVVS